MKLTRVASCFVAIAAAVAGTVLLGPVAATAANSGPTGHTVYGKPYPGDPAKEAALVAAEEKRIYDVRAITAVARWQGLSISKPYRLPLGAITTLVLVARPTPYTISDLEEIAPKTFTRLPDNSFLLSENIVVEQGATLQLANADGAVIHLLSEAKGFVSIVTQGGSLEVTGSSKGLVQINSWDTAVGKIDDQTTDGRAYVRVFGGNASFSYASFDHLGFWSGLTGGLALTGTQIRPSTVATAKGRPVATPSVRGVKLLPTGTIDSVTAGVQSESAGYSYVSAKLSHVTLSNNAYGLFVNGAQGVSISDTTANDNLVDGIVLHRNVTNSTIKSTVTSNNGVDGLAMTRASTGVVITQLTANGNGRDGISLNGGPLASGPNAAGMPTASYGNNQLYLSTAKNNGRYGVFVLGGSNVKVIGNAASGNFMGIVVSKGADGVVLRSNTVTNSVQHGISLLAGVTNSVVSHNTITGANIGLYLRDSSAIIDKNRISGVTNHGITLIGVSTASSISGNTVSGSGPNAIDTARSSGVEVLTNNSSNWINTKPFWVIVRSIFQPLTVLWILLGLLVVVTALAGSKSKRRGQIRHPYADHVPLASLTKGVVSPEALGLTAFTALEPEGKRDRAVVRERNVVRQPFFEIGRQHIGAK